MIKVRFHAESGELLSEQVVEKFPATLGRDDSCDVKVADGGVSSKHAEIDCDGLWFTIRDLGSRNGTFVGKEKISSTRLKLPCSLVLGNGVTMDVEIAASRSAVAVRASLMPKALKRPEVAHSPMPVMPAPIPAVRTVVLEEAEVVDGWEMYWHMLKKASPRPVLLAMIGLAFFYTFAHFIVFRENFFFSLGSGFGAALGCAIVAAILAAVLALPGVLFRGSYDFKPLFIIYCLSSMLMAIQIAILRPAMLMEYFGYVAQFLSLPLILLSCIPCAYVFFFTTFSHKHAKKLAFVSVFFAIVGVFSESKKVLTIDRQVLMREALMGEFRSARGLAGSTSSVSSITDDIRDFGRGTK